MHAPLSLIPVPRLCAVHGESQTLTSASSIAWAGAGARQAAELLADALRPATGFPWPLAPLADAPRAEIQLIQTGPERTDEAGFAPEAYELSTGPSGACIQAECGTGLLRGIQTLRQLLPTTIYASETQPSPWILPGVRIEDEPRFRWRGLHLDVSRHFFAPSEVCRFIELLAQHRMNVCHLHLTDDQGWRVEIRRYPRLTEIGSRRACTLVGHESERPRRYDGQPYGGFYTQDDVRDIVAFAARRGVMVVPEIDMPGHMQAALAAYPELGNTVASLEPRCHWGISHHVLNVEDETVAFMGNVLDEVMAMFPARFIHIGGDEATKQEWSESRRAQERMAQRGLRSENELQSGFIRQLDAFLAARGRRLIGWDEILEGGLAEGAAVMNWRSEANGIAAARDGHDVVMAPGHSLYFDHYQDEPVREEPLAIGGCTTTARVYAYDPIPKVLEAAHHKHILGAQGQLWTEYIPDLPHLEYMTYPRACALAEILWCAPEQRNYPSFLRRLEAHRARFAGQGVHVHPRP